MIPAARGSAQVRLAPLTRPETLYRLGEISIGFVVCAADGMTTRRPAFHAVERGAVVILTLMTPELEQQLEAEQPITYLAESVNEVTLAGWYASLTGLAEVIVDPVLRMHYQRALPGFESGHGARVLRLRPRSVDGHRFQRITAAL